MRGPRRVRSLDSRSVEHRSIAREHDYAERSLLDKFTNEYTHIPTRTRRKEIHYAELVCLWIALLRRAFPHTFERDADRV